MAYQSFEKLDVWQRACTLVVNIYSELKDSHHYSFREQISRAAVSIPSNIAEGAERNSNKEFKLFLGYAKGFAAEVRTQLYLAKKIGLISTVEAEKLITEAKHISGKLHALIQSLT
jgi:four helix bundle protein